MTFVGMRDTLPVGPVDALGADGARLHIRPVAPRDEAALRGLHADVSRANRYLRFFSQHAEPPGAGGLALLAERDGRAAGVGCYEPLGPEEAEIAFLVDDRCHGQGIGTLLLAHLATAARARGILQFRADVLAANREMLHALADSRFAGRVSYGGRVTGIVLDTAEPDRTSPARRRRQ